MTWKQLPTFVLFAAMCAPAAAQLPPVPEIQLPDPAATGPGAYPNTSVSSALFRIVSPPGVINAGTNQDQIQVSVPFAGPIAWTTNRYNEGDIAVQLAPFDVATANALLGTSPPWEGSAAESEYKFEGNTQPQTQVWNISSQVGVIFATPAQNVVSWDDGLPDYYPTVALARASSGFGYNMVDGSWNRGGIDLNLGTYGDTDETNFSTATAWFPFAGDWISGWIGDPDASGNAAWAGEGTHSPRFNDVDIADVFTWTDVSGTNDVFTENGGAFGGIGTLTLGALGIDAGSDGMLFTISDDGSSSTNVTAATPLDDGSGWIYSNREDSQDDAVTVAANDQSSFGFVYIPYDSVNLVGGHVNGGDGTTFQQAGSFELQRTNTGIYSLKLGDKTEADGVLMLANADVLATSAELADNNHLSYEWDAASGSFLINARHFGDGNAVLLEDTDFYFAWLDFENPIRMTTQGSDLTIDDLCTAIAADSTDSQFDLNGDGVVNGADVTTILESLGSHPGDADIDGQVQFSDFVILANNFSATERTWTQGDFDCDGEVQFSDFVILANNFGVGSNNGGGGGGEAAAVPEPSSAFLFVCGLTALAIRRRSR